MELEELKELKQCNTEADLLRLIQEIDDKVIFKGYNIEQILCLVSEIIGSDLLSIKYETREEILHLMCDVIAYYGFLDGVKWECIIKIKEELEDDLKEYITEFMEPITN